MCINEQNYIHFKNTMKNIVWKWNKNTTFDPQFYASAIGTVCHTLTTPLFLIFEIF